MPSCTRACNPRSSQRRPRHLEVALKSLPRMPTRFIGFRKLPPARATAACPAAEVRQETAAPRPVSVQELSLLLRAAATRATRCSAETGRYTARCSPRSTPPPSKRLATTPGPDARTVAALRTGRYSGLERRRRKPTRRAAARPNLLREQAQAGQAWEAASRTSAQCPGGRTVRTVQTKLRWPPPRRDSVPEVITGLHLQDKLVNSLQDSRLNQPYDNGVARGQGPTLPVVRRRTLQAMTMPWPRQWIHAQMANVLLTKFASRRTRSARSC